MTWPDDASYLHAKAVKRGRLSLPPEFADFVNSFERLFHVRPLWIELDTVIVPGHRDQVRPRVDVVIEHEADFQMFRRVGTVEGVPLQKDSTELFCQHVEPEFRTNHLTIPPDTKLVDDAFVIFSSFSQTAVRETHGLVTQAGLEEFALSLKLGDSYWHIGRWPGNAPTLFVHTTEQAEMLAHSPARETWNDAYFSLATQKDEFDVFGRNDALVKLDSKQNFDENYESNWFYYWR